MSPLLAIPLSLLATVAVITTGWSLATDLKIYRAWKREQEGPKPRWQRRRENADELADEQRRWSRLILALQCAGFGLLLGTGLIVWGYLARRAGFIVTGANLVFLGLVAWVLYQLVLPKPRRLREKKLPFQNT